MNRKNGIAELIIDDSSFDIPFFFGFLCSAKAHYFDQVSFVGICFYFYCLGRLTLENTGIVYVNVLPMYSSRRFMLLCLVYKSLRHLAFILYMVHGYVVTLLIYRWLSSFPLITC